MELTERVLSLMRSERWQDTIKVLKSEFDVTRTDWKLSWNLGWCYFKLDRLEDARKHLARAAKLAPQNATCRWALGCVYRMKKQFRKAEKNLVASLRSRDLHIARIALALTYLEQGKIEQAENVHLEGIKLKPKASGRYESYACFLSDVGREREAEKMYRKAKQLREMI
jgi:Flp pilus assembly protein TadD